MASGGNNTDRSVDEIGTCTATYRPPNNLTQLLQRARGTVTLTPEEVAASINRGLQLCSGGGGSDGNGSGSDFATASLINGEDTVSMRNNDRSSRNNGPPSMNQNDGRAMGISQNQRPPAAEYEVNRLSTFRNWPSSAPVMPSALAWAGFFYTGKDDIVECFICQGQIRDFEYGDTAMGEHKKHFPRCPFVKNKNHGNVPMAGNPDFSTISTSDPAGATGTSTERKAKEKEASLFSSKDAEKLKASSKDKKSKGASGGGKNGKKSGKGSPKPEDDDPATKADNQAKLTFKSEFKRLLSYQNWPEECPVDPRDCAKAGFFYTGKEDVVQCFACFGKLANWKNGDVPMVEHNRNFPSCPYILGLGVGNQPITSVQNANALHSIKYKDQSAAAQRSQGQQQKPKAQLTQTAKPTADWGPQNQRPNQKRVFAKVRHPQFASEQARLESYERWPPAVGIAPIQLARAGFFYTGSNDSCKCFYCDGGLKNWEPKHEPWMEHTRWFPRCEWLIQQRGQAYVDYVVHNFPPPRISAEGNRKGNAGGEGGEDEAGAFQTARMAIRGAAGGEDDSTTGEREPEAGVARTNVPRTVAKLVVLFKNLYLSYITKGSGGTVGELSSSAYGDKLAPQTAPPGLGGLDTRSDEDRLLPATVHDLKSELERYRDSQLCKICMDKDMSTVFLPCNHMVACDECATALSNCPICRKKIKKVVHIYKT